MNLYAGLIPQTVSSGGKEEQWKKTKGIYLVMIDYQFLIPASSQLKNLPSSGKPDVNIKRIVSSGVHAYADGFMEGVCVQWAGLLKCSHTGWTISEEINKMPIHKSLLIAWCARCADTGTTGEPS